MRNKACLLALAIVLLAALTARADWHTATVGAGNSISNIAVDPVRNRTYVANGSGTVSVVDGKTNAVQTWTAGMYPNCLAVNPVTGRLYVSTSGPTGTDTVLAFDTTGTIVGRLAVKDDPCDMVLDLDSNRLFVSHYGSDTVRVYQNDVFLADIPTGSEPYKMALNPVNRKIYIVHTEWDSVTCIDLDALTVSSIYVGDGISDLAVNASVNKAYVVNNYTDSVAVIDCATNTVTAWIGTGHMPNSVVCDPAGQRAYIADFGGNSITIINCVTDVVEDTAPLGFAPVTMAVNPATRKLYVNNGSSDPWLRIVDGRTGNACDSVDLGHPYWALAVNPVTNRIYAGLECGAADSVAVIDGSDLDTTLVPAKANTYDVVVNPISGDAYATNGGSDNVTVIKANGDTLTIAVGDNPQGLAVNPLTNKVFVCNFGGKSVSVINGSTYSVETTIPVDTLPTVIAVNPLTNYIYVNSFITTANRIKVIDGKDWDTTSVPVGSKPFSIAVNPVTNRIYVGNDVSGNVTVIDGAHHKAISTIPSITRPYKIEVNPATNKIYCASLATSGRVNVIDGATNAATSIVVGNWPDGLTVDRASNKVYVSNYNDNTVSEIDGATNTVTATIPVGTHPWGTGADPVTGKVFVCNNGSASVSVIDCASRSVKTIAAAAGPQFLSVNQVTGKVYAACNSGSGVVAVIDQTVEQDTRVNTYNDAAANPWAYVTPAGNQNRGYSTTNHWSPYKTKVAKGLFSLAGPQSFWKFGSNYSHTDTSLSWSTDNGLWACDTAFYGENIMRCFGLETQAGATNNLGPGTPFVGNVLNGMLYRIDYEAPTFAWWDSLADDDDSLDGYGPYTVRTVITDFSGVDTAFLHYNLAARSKAYLAMTRALADTFVGIIPAQTVGVGDTMVMSYMIEAWDHANNHNNTFNYTVTPQRYIRLRNLNGVAGQPADPTLPRTFALQAACPNPSAGRTVIRYQLPRAAEVNLTVYNVAGQLVKSFNEGQKPAGYHQVSWNDGKLPNGIYFYKLKAGQFSATRKMVVLK